MEKINGTSMEFERYVYAGTQSNTLIFPVMKIVQGFVKQTQL